MASEKKEPGPTARRVAEAIRRIRRGDTQDITTAEMSRRLTAIGQPIPDSSITKTEQGTRRVDVDDLVAISLVLGVTPNTLLMPAVEYVGSDDHHLTPVVTGTAEGLWQWAQGERPVLIPLMGARAWLGDGEHPDLEFSFRTRPYLTVLHAPAPAAGAALPDTPLRELSAAVAKALKGGASGTDIRRTVELTITLPVVMTHDEIDKWLEDGTRPKEGQ